MSGSAQQSSESRPTVAVFRPDDERIDTAVELLTEAGFDPVPDPMLAITPTGSLPSPNADYIVFTSKTGVDIISDADWTPNTDAKIVAIGTSTADALRTAGYPVDRIPETYTSSGLVTELRTDMPGATVEVARSDHGSDVLIDGLEDAGATVSETILYTLNRPDDAGVSVDLLIDGKLDAILFTSSLTVTHFIDVATERQTLSDLKNQLRSVTVGVIGPPTADTAASNEIDVDFVASTADFEVLVSELQDHFSEN